MANDYDSSLEVIQVYQAPGDERWYPVDPRNHYVVNNEYIDGARLLIRNVCRDNESGKFVYWEMDNKSVRTEVLRALETSRASKKTHIRINGIIVNPMRMTASKKHKVRREVLDVHDRPVLEVRKCLAPPDETVKLIRFEPRSLLGNQCGHSEPEVVVQPVSDDEFRVAIKTALPIKQEPIDPHVAQKPDSIPEMEVARRRPRSKSANETPINLRRSMRIQATGNPYKAATDAHRRRKTDPRSRSGRRNQNT
ncbi:uncharacterized protein LOC100905294 [Galendromus occidentalis]|uniref:Uncharacterized protein LOC100905294 n=1 Tax=Galendromus occidentalis TaxID=34638 RepID=A0AAJ6VZK3_9ACAR|nr:uncharacterized protein LOC100905294 [Galendromus occidentalis]